jgi:hypothetical protein
VYQISPHLAGLYNPELQAKVLVPNSLVGTAQEDAIPGVLAIPLAIAWAFKSWILDFRLFFDAAQEKFWLLWQSAEHTGKPDVPNLTKTESSPRERQAGGNNGSLPPPQGCGLSRCSTGVSTLLFFRWVSS